MRQLTGYEPRIALSPNSRWDGSNPWRGEQDAASSVFDPSDADILFLAGMDWLVLAEEERMNPPKPAIDLIQHVRHASLSDSLHRVLDYPALRICVSPAVADAIRATGRANGPIVTIANGIDLGRLAILRRRRRRLARQTLPRLMVVGIKQPGLVRAITDQLAADACEVDCLITPIP